MDINVTDSDLSTRMIREMVRQFLQQPGDFLTFGQLQFRIPNSDREVLHAVAENRADLFVIAGNDRALKLLTDAVVAILRDGIEAVLAKPAPPEVPA